jgi:hypothetical protein
MSEIFFNFGDLVRVDGYWPRVFKVDGYREEKFHYPDEQWTDIVYELYDVVTSEWLEADIEDLTLVETSDKADDYLAANPPQYEVQAPITPDWMTFMFGGDETMSKSNEPRKPTAREISAKEADDRKKARKVKVAEIDNFLELRKWASDMLEKTGNEAFGDRVMALDAELKKLVEKE